MPVDSGPAGGVTGRSCCILGRNLRADDRSVMAAEVAYAPLYVAADGKRFLLSLPAAQQNTPQPPLTVTLHWTPLLKK